MHALAGGNFFYTASKKQKKTSALSALTMLVGRQEGHLACKN